MLTNFINEAARAMEKANTDTAKISTVTEAGRVSIKVNKRPASVGISIEDKRFYERARNIYSRARRTHLTRAAAIF